MHASTVRTSFPGLFIKNNAREVQGLRGRARTCWTVCDPRFSRAEEAAPAPVRAVRSIWASAAAGSTN